jgi:hypothetical protein
VIFLISASWAAKIIGVNHHSPVIKNFSGIISQKNLPHMHILVYIFIYLCWWCWGLNLGLVLARQVFYHLRHTFSPHMLIFKEHNGGYGLPKWKSKQREVKN